MDKEIIKILQKMSSLFEELMEKQDQISKQIKKISKIIDNQKVK